MRAEIECSVSELIAKVQASRVEHISILAEARRGYIIKAAELASKWLDELEAGKPVRLHAPFIPPSSYVRQYDTALAMLSAHVSPTITIGAADYSTLALNQWVWQREFYAQSSAYSPSATAKLAELESDD